MVEYALPFVGELILVMNDNFLLSIGFVRVVIIFLVLFSNGLYHFGQEAKGCSGVGSSVIGNVEGGGSEAKGTEGLFFDFAEDKWSCRGNDIEAVR